MSSDAMIERGRGGPEDTVGTGEQQHGHISLGTYVLVGVALGVLMTVKVAIYYIPALDDFRTPILVVLSMSKLMLVVLFFMHLKVDHRVFSWVFMIGAVLAVLMVGALTILYHVLPGL